MPTESKLQQLIEKVRSGKSTPDEDLALLRFLNDSMRAFLAVVHQLKIAKVRRSLKSS